MQSQCEKLRVKHCHVRRSLKAPVSLRANMDTEIAWQIIKNKLTLLFLKFSQNENTKSESCTK